jgi:hypothetical protein
LLLCAVGTITIGVFTASCQHPHDQDAIRGVVHDHHGPIEGALVRVQTTEIHTTTNQEGEFVLDGLGFIEPVSVTAWAPGYYIAAAQDVVPGVGEIEIQLEAHANSDHPDYAWLPSEYHPGQGEDQGCAECHSSRGTDLQFSLPVDEWLEDAHSQAAVNPRFVSMYNGTDLSGNQSPPTRFASNRDYGSFPLRPDPTQPYYGPGYKLDFPETDGNCAACHTPAASVNDPYGVDPTRLEGVPAEGVPCDFCHKIWDVRLNPDTGMPYPNMPGVLSYEFRRPPEGHQFFAGPLDDVAPGEDTYSPWQEQSQICAPCHFGIFWDTLVYNSFGEWLESPYSDPETGQTCQDCHMPPLGVNYFARPDQGGLDRDPDTIFSHRMPGAADEELLQNAVSIEVVGRRTPEEIVVEVILTNDQTGHHVPTDSPLRQMILLVQARDASGKDLAQTAGPTLPDWAGVGDPAQGYYAGLPGMGYAKILEELWTEVSPTGAYWNPTRVLSDNRLAAFESHASTYAFALPESGSQAGIEVEVRLIFRRAFKELMDQKGWDVPDLLMEQETFLLP